MDNANLKRCVAAAIDRIGSTLHSRSPFLSREVLHWMNRISPNGDPAAHLIHPRMFPLLQLPEWIVETFPAVSDFEFQQSVIDSSINGYYYIRLIDDVIDGDREPALAVRILPAAGFFCSRFQLPYHAHFSSQLEFWQVFNDRWTASCESTAHDAHLSSVSWKDFENVCSRKYSAAGIPMAAACYHFGRPELIGPWFEFVDDFARWSQMLDDTIDWHTDRREGRATYFISEGERRKRASESLDHWVTREGFAWAFALLEEWMKSLHMQAAKLGSGGLQEYLTLREMAFREQRSILLRGFAAIAHLAAILDENSVEA